MNSALMTLIGALALLAPLCSLLLAAFIPLTSALRTNIVAAFTILVAAILVLVNVPNGNAITFAGELFHLSERVGVFLLIIGAVGAISSAYAIPYLHEESMRGETDPRRIRQFAWSSSALLLTMTMAALSNNIGVFWVALETTTLATAVLVTHHRSTKAFEAAWKYVLLCAVGLAIAFGGIALLYQSLLPFASGISALNWNVLIDHAHEVDPSTARLGIAIFVLGIGTKVGLLPLNSWLPDAHGQAPAPVSAMMSGALIAVAVSGVMQIKPFADAALGPAFLQSMLFVASLATLVFAAFLIVTQRDLKRMLAYSSIEHMSIVVLAIAVGTPLAISSALVHLVGHSIAKAAVFCASGHLVFASRTTLIDESRGAMARSPKAGAVFAIGMLGLVGFPPYVLFATEITLIAEIVRNGHWIVGVVFLLALSTATLSLLAHSITLLFGTSLTRQES